MTGTNLYDMVTALNGGQAMDVTLFYQILLLVQEKYETYRNWMWLRKQDSSLTMSPGDTSFTARPLPTDFNKFQSERPIVLVDTNNRANFQPWYQEVPLSWQYDYQFTDYRYCLDVPANNFYILGSVSQSYKIIQNYLYKPPAITTNTAWVFPGQYHPMLAFAVMAQQKSGVDFDDQNARMAASNQAQADTIFESMTKWDDQLQEMSVEGVDRSDNNRPWQSGSVNLGGTFDSLP